MNAKQAIDQLGNSIKADHFEGWKIDEVKVGRGALRGVFIGNREGAINFIETLTMMLERTRRRRAGGHHHLPIELAGAAPTRLLSVEIGNFMKSIDQRKLSIGFTAHARVSLRILLAVCGDIPVSKVEPDHIMKFWDAMRWWPHRPYLRKDFVGLTDAEILEVGRKENTSAPADITLNLRFRLVRSFFKGLVGMRILSRSPCDGFNKGIKIIATGPKRRPFNREELEKLFDPATFVPWASIYPHRWWMPIIGLYTGARVGEVAQLKVNDIECIQGQWFLHLQKTVDDDVANGGKFKSRQVFKSKSSVRTIPIHPGLIEAGFLEFVADIKKIKHPRLFPHLHARIDSLSGLPDGTGYSPPFTEQFGKHLRKMEFTRMVSFHSFRHYFSNQLRLSGVKTEMIAELTGHVLASRAPTLEGFYFHAEPEEFVSLVDAVNKLKPPVCVPRYASGQFARQLGPRVKLYP